MILAMILVFAAFAIVAVLLHLACKRAVAGRWLQNPAEQLRSVDLEAFRNLIDPAETRFLRTHLPLAEFRGIQRLRLRAAAEYVSAVAHNAVVLGYLGQAARLNPDPAIAASGGYLVDTAVRLRLVALHSLGLLYLGIVFPGHPVSLARVAERYDLIRGQMIRLGLRYPLHGVVAAL